MHEPPLPCASHVCVNHLSAPHSQVFNTISGGSGSKLERAHVFNTIIGGSGSKLERALGEVFNTIIGGSGSKLERALGDAFPEGERYFGLENFGNTCYCNSVLQALYFCVPFREHLLDYYAKHKPANESEETLLTCLAELFNQINSQKRKTGVIAPRRFVQRVKKQKELFRSYMHQDAHEFLNFLLNELVDILEKEARAGRAEAGRIIHPNPPAAAPAAAAASGGAASGGGAAVAAVRRCWGCAAGMCAAGVCAARVCAARVCAARVCAAGVCAARVCAAGVCAARVCAAGVCAAGVCAAGVCAAGGTLTNETRCLCCETVTARDEAFLDLSLDIEQNSSVTSCLRNFSSTETLNGNDKFFCDTCCSLQEAQKRMRIKVPPRVLALHLKRFKFMEQLVRYKKLSYREAQKRMRIKVPPRVLALHLKRFKFMEQLGRYKKLSYRVVFPLHLRLCNTVDDAPGAEAEYSLFAVIVHVGSGPNHGHYVALVKSHSHWLFFDDENVEQIDESLVQTYFGSSQDYSSNTDHGAANVVAA
ncbi:unnamed protein product [Closterium sp. Naga37s-1]|nr:unnamed protein product [Closterium sp. Naga37s-1]